MKEEEQEVILSERCIFVCSKNIIKKYNNVVHMSFITYFMYCTCHHQASLLYICQYRSVLEVLTQFHFKERSVSDMPICCKLRQHIEFFTFLSQRALQAHTSVANIQIHYHTICKVLLGFCL